MKRISVLLLAAIAIGVLLGVLSMMGCAHQVHHATTVPVDYNPVHHTLANLKPVEKALTVFNILGFIGLAASCGLFLFGLFYGNSILERPALLAASVCGGTVAVSLAGLVALPFAPYIVLIAAVGALVFAGYEVYARLIRKAGNTNASATL